MGFVTYGLGADTASYPVLTWVYKGIRGYIGFYKCIHGYTWVYKGIEGYTWVYRGI